MTLLVEQHGKKRKKTIMLTDWPESLISAYRAGILCGKAEEEAKMLDVPRKQTLSHPWRQPFLASGHRARQQSVSVTNL